MFKFGDPVIDDQGRTGEIDGREDENGYISVAFYNYPSERLPVDRLEYNDYADSEEEANELRAMHGDDYEDDYMEGLDRIKSLAGIEEASATDNNELMAITSEIYDIANELKMSQDARYLARHLTKPGQRLQAITGDQ